MITPKYISGDDLSAMCKYCWNGHAIFKSIENDWIFVRSDDIEMFFDNCQLSYFTLFTHNGDRNIGEEFRKYADDKRLKKWYAQNLLFSHPKVTAMPIGIANSHWSHGNKEILCNVQEMKIPKTRLTYANYHIQTNRPEREKCLHFTKIPLTPFINGGWNGFSGGYTQRNTFEGYLKDIASSLFCISPDGNGIDCHRTWEALYLKTIPIVTKSILTEQNKHLPMIVLNDWSEFKMDMLSEQRYYQLWKNFDISDLYLDNYLKKIV